MAAMLASRFPVKVPQLMTYQKTIVKAHRTYAGHAWVTYDLAYRRRAANLKSLDWGVIDFNLYTETFACRGKAIPRCKFCSTASRVTALTVRAYVCISAPLKPAFALVVTIEFEGR